jgi:hypothetical protein
MGTMGTTLLLSALPLIAAAGLDLKDAREVPAPERIAYINQVADRAGRDNARPYYSRAMATYKSPYDLAAKAPENEAEVWVEVLGEGEWELAISRKWSKDEQRLIHEWLRANKEALAAVEEATDEAKYFEPIKAESNRLFDALPLESSANLTKLFKLAAIHANAEALGGRWESAWAWNGRLRRMANHLYQQPFFIQHMMGMRIEGGACEQALEFLQHALPEHSGRMVRAIALQAEHQCPDELVEFAENVYALDTIEFFYAWAAEPTKHAKFGETVEAMVGPGSDLFREFLREEPGKNPFAGVDEFREALRGSSVEQAWECQLALNKLYAEWHAKPFPEAWKEVEAFRQAVRKQASTEPVQLLSNSMLDPDQYRYMRALTVARRNAVTSVIGVKSYQERWGRLPRKLENACPESLGHDPTDPFSGEPLRYRVSDDGQSFVIYSVGPDQDDDGGEHNGFKKDDGDFVLWPPQPALP